MMRIGCVDAGNTNTKVALYENEILVHEDVLTISKVSSWAIEQQLSICVVSNVSKQEINKPKHFGGKWIDVNTSIELPFTINYQQPTLGPDRIAAVAFAHAKYPNNASLIIDLGTCITTDFIDESGTYQGGSISPGVFMRFKAMHEFTGRLPNIQEVSFANITGKNTAACMKSGVFHGILFEIQGFINHYSAQYPNINILITGGDAALFVKHIKNSIFAAPDLVLQGLKEIALYHAKKGI
jgi:type III pantothenate kinase